MTSIQYEDIRSSLRVILADTPPDMQQVSRVLEKMGEISATDASSAPVLDWDKDERILHITDRRGPRDKRSKTDLLVAWATALKS